MCEYCLSEWYKRNTYELKGTNDNNAEVFLSLDGEEGLLIKAEWDNFFEKENKSVKMCLAAEAIIRYCPWCGRKLKEGE
jgi:hypothetical protein